MLLYSATKAVRRYFGYSINCEVSLVFDSFHYLNVDKMSPTKVKDLEMNVLRQ